MCFSLACICDFATASRMVQGALALPLGGRILFDREILFRVPYAVGTLGG